MLRSLSGLVLVVACVTASSNVLSGGHTQGALGPKDAPLSERVAEVVDVDVGVDAAPKQTQKRAPSAASDEVITQSLNKLMKGSAVWDSWIPKFVDETAPITPLSKLSKPKLCSSTLSFASTKRTQCAMCKLLLLKHTFPRTTKISELWDNGIGSHPTDDIRVKDPSKPFDCDTVATCDRQPMFAFTGPETVSKPDAVCKEVQSKLAADGEQLADAIGAEFIKEFSPPLIEVEKALEAGKYNELLDGAVKGVSGAKASRQLLGRFTIKTGFAMEHYALSVRMRVLAQQMCETMSCCQESDGEATYFTANHRAATALAESGVLDDPMEAMVKITKTLRTPSTAFSFESQDKGQLPNKVLSDMYKHEEFLVHPNPSQATDLRGNWMKAGRGLTAKDTPKLCKRASADSCSACRMSVAPWSIHMASGNFDTAWMANTQKEISLTVGGKVTKIPMWFDESFGLKFADPASLTCTNVHRPGSMHPYLSSPVTKEIVKAQLEMAPKLFAHGVQSKVAAIMHNTLWKDMRPADAETGLPVRAAGQTHPDPIDYFAIYQTLMRTDMGEQEDALVSEIAEAQGLTPDQIDAFYHATSDGFCQYKWEDRGQLYFPELIGRHAQYELCTAGGCCDQEQWESACEKPFEVMSKVAAKIAELQSKKTMERATEQENRACDEAHRVCTKNDRGDAGLKSVAVIQKYCEGKCEYRHHTEQSKVPECRTTCEAKHTKGDLNNQGLYKDGDLSAFSAYLCDRYCAKTSVKLKGLFNRRSMLFGKQYSGSKQCKAVCSAGMDAAAKEVVTNRKQECTRRQTACKERVTSRMRHVRSCIKGCTQDMGISVPLDSLASACVNDDLIMEDECFVKSSMPKRT